MEQKCWWWEGPLSWGPHPLYCSLEFHCPRTGCCCTSSGIYRSGIGITWTPIKRYRRMWSCVLSFMDGNNKQLCIIICNGQTETAHLTFLPVVPSPFSYSTNLYCNAACWPEHEGWSTGMSTTCMGSALRVLYIRVPCIYYKYIIYP